jgi:hypothetical protein
MRVEHVGREHLLRLEAREVALLVDILEAALPAEAITGVAAPNPRLSAFFNDVYSHLLDTAREVWHRDPGGRALPLGPG